MTTNQLQKLFDKHGDAYLEFGRVKTRRSARPDIHAFLLLEELCPAEGQEDIVAHAENDEIYLSIDPAELAKVATEAHVIELLRCGVIFTKFGCLGMHT